MTSRGGAQRADGSRLHQEQTADVAGLGTQRAEDADLPPALDDGHHHRVGNAEGGREESDQAHQAEAEIEEDHHAADLFELLGKAEAAETEGFHRIGDGRMRGGLPEIQGHLGEALASPVPLQE